MKKRMDGVRINKYMAQTYGETRRSADDFIALGKVFINDRVASLGDMVYEHDTVRIEKMPSTHFKYLAYNKPKKIVTHSPQGDERSIADVARIGDVVPIGDLDKEAHGLVILTNDRRLVKALANPNTQYEQEYFLQTKTPLKENFMEKIKKGVLVGGIIIKPTKVSVHSDNECSFTITEHKRHLVRQIMTALKYELSDLQRVRILGVTLGGLQQNQFRTMKEKELQTVLSVIGTSQAKH